MQGVSRAKPVPSILQHNFGLYNLKACHYVATQVDGNFEAYSVFVSVHGNVSLMLVSEQWLRYESWLSSLHKMLCRFKHCKSGMNLVVATQQMDASTVQRCTFLIQDHACQISTMCFK